MVPLHCERAMTLTDSPVGEVWMCERCGHGQVVVPAEIPQKPTPKTTLDRACETRESDLVQAIKRALEERGFIVLVVSQLGGKRSGTTVGACDMFAAKLPANVWRGLEVKLRGGKVSPAQQALVDAGVSTLVYSVEDALKAVGR